MLSRLANDPDGMSTREIVATAIMLLIGGHETTVNLISNGMIQLLRHPEELQKLRREPGLIVPAVEEILRFDPPRQFRFRVASDTLRDYCEAIAGRH